MDCSEPNMILGMEQIKQTTITNELTPQGEDDLPQWVHIMPSGVFKRDEAGAAPLFIPDPQALIEASTRPTVEMVIDRDHELINASEGAHKPAAGWVKEMAAREDGIWARIEWTEKAAEQIKAKEYRYISPVYSYNTKDGVINRIHHISLVNEPAFELKAVASKNLNQSKPEEETQMNEEQLKQMRAAFGLADDATAEQVIEAASKAAERADNAETELKSIRTGLKLEEKADAEAIIAAANKNSANDFDITQFVPKQLFDETVAKLKALTEGQALDEAKQAVDAAMKSGKITPANKAWAMQCASKDLAEFNKFLENAPTVVGTDLASKKETASKKQDDGVELTAAQKEMADTYGMSHKEYAEGLAQEAALTQ